jgi:peptidyl-prolyl cis-trans isomerase D
MLTWFRKLLENWIARVFFGLLVVVFVFWGISNVMTLASTSTTVAHVAGKPIDLSVVQIEYQTELNQAEQKSPPDQAGRQKIAQNALSVVVRQQVFNDIEAALHITVPDAALRQTIQSIPAFQTAGAFDNAKFNQVLLQNNFTPARFIAEEKADMANQQLVTAIAAGAAAPTALTNQIFSFVAQARSAETVDISTAAQIAPPPPSAATLLRYWKNHPKKYTAPEFRTVKIVILSPAILAPTEPVSQAELQAAYAQTAASLNLPATRSVQILTVPDPTKAQKLAADWKAGATWPQIQTEAAANGATAVELDHQKQNQFPSEALGAAIFAASPNAVTGPMAGPFGAYVFTVTNAIAAGAPSFATLAPQLTQQVQLQKAQQAVNQDVDNVQDALAGQTPLDKLPGNLGLTAVEGTLDANGNTLDGTQAPIPGGADLRAAIIKAIFAAHVGDPAQLITGPQNSYFAFTIDTITPPAAKPYNQVQTQVAADWQHDQLQREAEQRAAALMQSVNAGGHFDAAAAAAGLPVTPIAPISRGSAPVGIPESAVPVLFSLTQGQAAMLPSPDGFLVMALTKIENPTPADAPDEVAGIQQALNKSLQTDTAESFLQGLQAREHVSIDPKLFAQIYQ